PQIGRLAKSHGTQMPGHFRSAVMGGSNGGAKLRRSDEHVGLEIVHSLVEPEIYRADRVLGPGELVRLNGPGALAFQIWAADMHPGASHFSGVDRLLEFKVGVGLECSGGANRGHARGKIQTRKTKRHLAENSVSHGV